MSICCNGGLRRIQNRVLGLVLESGFRCLCIQNTLKTVWFLPSFLLKFALGFVHVVGLSVRTARHELEIRV